MNNILGEPVSHPYRTHEIRVRTLRKTRNSVTTILEELLTDRGASWNTIAIVSNLSVSTAKRLRTGGKIGLKGHTNLAKFASLLDMLEENGFQVNPVAWMETNLPLLESGYNIRPLDLYFEGHDIVLVDLAAYPQTVFQTLDRVRPGWRKSRSMFETFVDGDGYLSLRMRND